MLEVKNIKLKVKKQQLVSGDLSCYPGQMTYICGDIGSGKTTLLNHLFKQQFDLYINHEKISDFYQITSYVNQIMGMYNDFTFKEIVDCFRYEATIDFSDVGIKYVPNKKISKCSQGEKQRISLLIALWKNPSILILDEPTAFLDQNNHDKIMKIIKDYTQTHQCITILTSHAREDRKYADRIYEIKNGKLVLEKESPSNQQLVFKKEDRNIDCLVHWIGKKVLKPIRNLMCLGLILIYVFLNINIHLLEKNENTWLETSDCYYLSYDQKEGSLPLYYDEKLIEINGDVIPIGIMNYYSKMNMHAINEQQPTDIIITEALKEKLLAQNIEIDNQIYAYSNVMKDGTNEILKPLRYMIYIPNEKVDADVYGYVLAFQNGQELKEIAEGIYGNDYFIGDKNPLSDYQNFLKIIKPYQILLKISPIFLSIILILIRLLLERKYLNQMSLLFSSGMSQKKIRKIRLQNQIFPMGIAIFILLNHLTLSLSLVLYILIETKILLDVKVRIFK